MCIRDSNFQDNNTLYITYAKKLDENGGNTTVARAKYNGNSLVDLEDIFVSKQSSEKGYHWGSRIAFDKAGHLYFGIGDRGSRDINPQDLYRDGGKVFRINDDGSIPSDNPYVDKIGINPAIYSYGHRNPQGIFYHPGTDEIWTNEHGPRGGDEINIIKPLTPTRFFRKYASKVFQAIRIEVNNELDSIQKLLTKFLTLQMEKNFQTFQYQIEKNLN